MQQQQQQDVSLRNYLYSLQYRDIEKTARDIEYARSLYPNLRLVGESFAINGISRNLAALNGTIPVTYRGSTYNIPVSVKIGQEYPLRAPDVFVVPTASMVIKATPHVDTEGRVYHPLLAYWGQNGREVTLISVIEVMRECFGLQTPVYAKPTTGNVSGGSPHSLPAQSGYSPMMSGASLGPSHSQPSMYGNSIGQNQNYPPNSSPPFKPTPSQTFNSNINQANGNSTNHQGFSELDEERIRLESLKSAAQDKIVPHLLTLHEMMSRDMEKLLDENKSLIEGGNSLKVGLSSLSDNIVTMESTISTAESTVKELDAAIDHLSSMQEPSVDDLIVIEDSLEKQSFRLMSREQALEDLIYVQSKHFMTLGSAGVDLATFMKWIRSTSRDLFLTKALVKKISKIKG